MQVILQPHHKISSFLEQIVRIKNPLKMSTQVRANSFTGSKTHLHCNLSPSSVLADHFKASLLLDKLDRDKCKGVAPYKKTCLQPYSILKWPLIKYVKALLNICKTYLRNVPNITLALHIQAFVTENHRPTLQSTYRSKVLRST